MSILLFLACAAGAGLAFLFKVPALIALSLLLGAAGGAFTIAVGWPLLDGVLRIAMLLAALQTSYLLSLGLAAFATRRRLQRSGGFVPAREGTDRPYEDHQIQPQ